MRPLLDREAERNRLEAIAADSWYAEGANRALALYGARLFGRFWSGDSCLELGPAEGLMTEALERVFPHLTLVDGSETFCAELSARFPNAEVVTALFEDYEPGRTFDTIMLGNVLEHVDSPRELLARAREWLTTGGRLYASVPNARSIHRQAAVLLGLLEHEAAFNDADRHHGHRRVYDPESLRADVLAAGLQIEMFGGYWLKPLSNAQIEADWTDEMLEAFMALGERYPDIAAQLYVVARR